ncbi:hypothetical protein T439DRAFT_65142 [Meredithblackwellia eburnea MCA 4105]
MGCAASSGTLIYTDTTTGTSYNCQYFSPVNAGDATCTAGGNTLATFTQTCVYSTPGTFQYAPPCGVTTLDWILQGGVGGTGTISNTVVGQGGLGALLRGTTSADSELAQIIVGAGGGSAGNGPFPSSPGNGGGYSRLLQLFSGGLVEYVAGGGGGKNISFPRRNSPPVSVGH